MDALLVRLQTLKSLLYLSENIEEPERRFTATDVAQTSYHYAKVLGLPERPYLNASLVSLFLEGYLEEGLVDSVVVGRLRSLRGYRIPEENYDLIRGEIKRFEDEWNGKNNSSGGFKVRK